MDKTPKVDKYSIKNHIKFKIENAQEKLVTPYFLSMNPDQRIYFITNNLANAYEPTAYYNINTVPIYSNELDQPPYYKTCKYEEDINGNNNLIYQKINIHDINKVYTNEEKTEYNRKLNMPAKDTFAFKNDAYLNYALKFYIEEVSADVLGKLTN
jgi:hypothetical protein